MDEISILLVEDHTLVREGLRSLLSHHKDLRVIADAADGQEAMTLIERQRPDVVVMDISMPKFGGLEATRQIAHLYPEIRVIILTMYRDEEFILQSLHAGARAYLLKESASAELVAAIRAAARGEYYVSPAASGALVENLLKNEVPSGHTSRFELLTGREREVLQLIAEGHGSRSIAGLLHISANTVRVHRKSIMEKLNLHTNVDLTRYALRKGVSSLDT
jgi:DNA-binding NarL/FixJ family response regulator